MYANIYKTIHGIHYQDNHLIDQLCQPLKHIGLSYFSYAKFYRDGGRLDITNHPGMTEMYYLKERLYKYSAIEGNPFAITDNVIVWDSYPEDESIKIFKKEYKMGHGISYVEQHHDYCEMWHFAAPINNHKVNNFYHNHPDILQLFKFHFLEKGQSLINRKPNNSIIVLTSHDALPNQIDVNYSNIEFDQFKQSLDIQRFYLGEHCQNQYLTQREFECLYYFAKGNTPEIIADILEISKRTTELHLERIKNKLGCCNQSELMRKAYELHLDMKGCTPSFIF